MTQSQKVRFLAPLSLALSLSFNPVGAEEDGGFMTFGGIEEERRLFYVAITRAKENLWLSYAKNELRENAKPKEHKPSVFLYEAGLLKPDLK